MVLSPLLINIVKSSSNIRCQPGEGPPSNSQPNVKRQKLDGSTESSAAGMSASIAITIDDVADEEDDDSIEILEDEDDDDKLKVVLLPVLLMLQAPPMVPHSLLLY